MYWIRERLEPIAKEYDRYINGTYLYDMLSVKGGQFTAGTDYISKVFRAQGDQILRKYSGTVECVKNPTFEQFLNDNFTRIFFLNAIERLVTAVQAYPVMKASLSNPGTVSHTFTQITNQGILRGMLKGSLLSLTQFGLVFYPSVYLANKSSFQYGTLLASYSVLDALLYPLDSIKSIMYAETQGGLNLRQALKTCERSDYYKGIQYKLLFNIPYLTSIYLTTQAGCEIYSLLSWGVTAALYPLLTLKTQNQLLGNYFSHLNELPKRSLRSQYRGLIPFLAMNLAFSWTLRPLFSEAKLEELKEQTTEEFRRNRGL